MKRYEVLCPVPVMALAQVLEQVEKQGWNAGFIAFAGMVNVTTLATPKPQAAPSYSIVCSAEDATALPLKISVGGENAKSNRG